MEINHTNYGNYSNPINKSINQYNKCLHRTVASTVQIITVRTIQNSEQLLKIKDVIDRKQQKTDLI